MSLKVFHLETGRYVYGGARQVLYLLEHLPALDTDCRLVCAEGAEIGSKARAQGATVTELPMRGDLDLPFAFRLARLLREERPDLLHVHSRRGADVWGALAAKMAGVPALLSRRVDNAEGRLAVALKYPLYRHVICVADGVREVLIGNGVPADQLSVVRSAINPALYRNGASKSELCAEFGLDPGAPVLGIIAQLIPRKGHLVLFDALAALADRQPRVQLIVFGRGPLSPTLPAEAAARGLQKRVVFPGFREDLGHWLGGLDLMVHPAFTEGLANAALQASAAGVPTIGSRVGGIPEAIADGVTGLLVPPREVAPLAEAIDRLLSDEPLRRRLGAAGPGFVEAGFTAERMAAGNRAVYRRLFGR